MKKDNKSKLFLNKITLISLATISVSAIFSGIAISFARGYISYHNVEVVDDSSSIQELAIGTHGSNTLYFKPTTAWNGDNPKYYAYCWKEEGGEIVGNQVFYPTSSTIGTGNDTVYVINAPFYTYTNCLFLRMSPNATGGSFNANDGFWNQTEDLTISSVYNFFTVTSMTGGADGKSAGTWSRYGS